jgi:ThiF family
MEGIPGLTILGPTVYDDESESWIIPVRLTIERPSDVIPENTYWYILIDPSYPLGRVHFHPSQEGGLHATFQHMQRNDPTDRPWRSGYPCLDYPARWMGSRAFSGQPDSASGRMGFHATRALEWLQAAADGRLTEDGDPFELPPFGTHPTVAVIAFDESADHLSRWSPLLNRFGRCVLKRLTESALVADDFRIRDDAVVPSRWGTRIASIDSTISAFWFTLPAMPVIGPWDTPRTWGELRLLAEAMRIDFFGKLQWIYHNARQAGITNEFPVLVGFAIPQSHGGPPFQIHWQALMAPAPIPEPDLKHARKGSIGAWTFQRSRTLRDESTLSWVTTENWSEDRLRVRGSLAEVLRKARIILLGAGALGSAVAELLVREGVNDLLVSDSEHVEAGNLRRHTLSLDSVGAAKAAALRDHLNAVSPFAKVQCVGAFPSAFKTRQQDLQDADVVIDCTANDDVIGHLGRIDFGNKPRWFFAGSLGVEARRLFLYREQSARFNTAMYHAAMQAHLPAERAALIEVQKQSPYLMFGAGCWNPVFPARWTNIVSLAAEMVHGIEATMTVGHFDQPLHVVTLQAT